MRIQTESMMLNCIRGVLRSEVNDVYICRDENAPAETCYTLIMIKNHHTAKEVLDIFENSARGKEALVKSFSWQNCFCLLFDYKKERNINQFYMGNAFSLHRCETICLHLVMECLSTPLPWPLLYLVLTQNQVHLEKDDSIYFSYQFDLTDFDKRKTEGDCVVKCAVLVRELLREHEARRVISFELLSLKIGREGYQTFSELYRDIRISAVPAQKRSLWRRMKSAFRRNKDRLFRIFTFLCIVLAVIALLTILSQLVFGNAAFYKFILNPFKMIGTESMLQ